MKLGYRPHVLILCQSGRKKPLIPALIQGTASSIAVLAPVVFWDTV